MTKEEFLDKKNSKLHKEILRIFNNAESESRLTMYLQNTMEEYPNLLCSFGVSDNTKVRPTLYSQQLLINMIEWFKRESIFEETSDGSKILAILPKNKL